MNIHDAWDADDAYYDGACAIVGMSVYSVLDDDILDIIER